MSANPKPYNAVWETTAVSGTGTATLLGAQPGCSDFSVVGTTNRCIVRFRDVGNSQFEETVCTLTISGGTRTLSRDKVLHSSNSDALVAFAGDTIDVVLVAPAEWLTPDFTFQARLTLTSGDPIQVADVTGASTLYLTPYRGNQVMLWNGYMWVQRVLSEINLSLSGMTTDLPYDVFLYDNAGTLTLESLAWSNATTRATAIAQQDGIDVKSGDATRLLVGSIRATGATTVDDAVLKRRVGNRYNWIRKPLAVFESTSSWTYNTNTWRQVRASSANQVDAMVCVAGPTVDLRAVIEASATGAAGATFASTGIGTNSTSSPDGNCVGMPTIINSNADAGIPQAFLTMQPSAGGNYWAWLELSSGTLGVTTSFFGTGGTPTFRRCGMTGSIQC